MRRLSFLLLPVFLLASVFSVAAATGKVVKVLPQFLDLKGRVALSPSLYDRDAYQAQLRAHPEQRSAMRFEILCRSRGANKSALKVRVELRGVAKGNLPRQKTLEQEVKAGETARWTSLKLEGDNYKELGDVTAWRVTLWQGDELLGEQKSFLW